METDAMDGMRDRIKQVMQKVGLNSITFAESIGIQQSTLSHVLNGRNRPSLDVVMKIHLKYPEISYGWLISGEGSMQSPEFVIDRTSSYDTQIPGLFDEKKENPTEGSSDLDFRKENGLNSPLEATKEIVRQEIKYIEKPPRKITEIRIFFDDNSFQIFTPQN
jgi:transcriptional regulator with XRE-family HTH domain